MPNQLDDIGGLLRRFPEHWGTIVELRKRSAEFQAFCSEYSAARLAWKRWQTSTLPSAGKLEAEYRGIVHELESELLQMLTQAEPTIRTLPEHGTESDTSTTS
jgi:ATP-dependent exoDNAse (exonuclease V) alpha subunit